ncbi:MAG: hypothetical protein E7270_06700 [Lachnospiraceae bacterium]|nr:hypothetical protein [Lachnospiraceae bacterium]
MKFNEIKIKDDFTIEMCRSKCRELELTTSILKMHYDLCKMIVYLPIVAFFVYFLKCNWIKSI